MPQQDSPKIVQTMELVIQPIFWQILNAFFVTVGLAQKIMEVLIQYIDSLANKKLKQDRNNNPELPQTQSLKSLKDIPGPRSYPVFGTLLSSPHLKLPDLMEANKQRVAQFGPIVKEEHFWGFPMILILDPNDIQIALRSVGSRPGVEIVDRYREMRSDRYDSLGLLGSQGEMWSRLHSAVAPLLSSPKFLRDITSSSDEIGSDFVDLIRHLGQDNTSVIPNIGELCDEYVAETAFFNVFGRRMGFLSFPGDACPNAKALTNYQQLYWEAFHDSAYRFSWWKYYPTKSWKQMVLAEDNINIIIDQFLQEAIKDVEDGSSDECLGLVHKILALDQLSYKDKRLVTQELVTGATDRVSTTLTFMLYWLSRDERVAKKLFTELKNILPHKNTPIDSSALDSMEYLTACMMETFRICPTAPSLARFTDKPLNIGGYDIPPNTFVNLQFWYAGMQEECFHKAHEFLPERWLKPPEDGPNKYSTYLPHRRQMVMSFGDGMRT